MPASLRDVDDADEDDVILSDAAGPNAPARVAPVNTRVFFHEPAHGTRNALRKLLGRDRVVGRGLVLGHDLAIPFAVTWPVDSDKSSGTISHLSSFAGIEERRRIARRGGDNGKAESYSIAVDEEYGHVQRHVGMTLGLVLWCPDALLDDRAAMPDGVVEQPSGAPLDDGEVADSGGREDNEESRRPLWVASSLNGVWVHLQQASEVSSRVEGSEHPSDSTVDVQIFHGEDASGVGVVRIR